MISASDGGIKSVITAEFGVIEVCMTLCNGYEMIVMAVTRTVIAHSTLTFNSKTAHYTVVSKLLS